MEKAIHSLNVYLANLATLDIKFHNLHWNVEGKDFFSAHQLTEKLYEQAQDELDELAEYLRSYELVPPSTMKEYLELATIKETESRIYSCEEVFETVLEDLQTQRNLAVDLRQELDDLNWYTGVAILEDAIASYSKTIWMIRATLK